MAASTLTILITIASVLASVYGLKCHEGIDMTVSGIPLYYWNQRECTGESKCIRQEITYSTDLAGLKFHTSMQYGACMSSVYADYLGCENLFGKDSNFDPTNFLRMLPGVAQSVTSAAQVFSKNMAVSLKQLLSNGTGIGSLVDGAYIFYENLGFNLEKAVPLKPSLAKLLTASIDGSTSEIPSAMEEFLSAFNQLDTENVEYAGALRSFLTNIGIDLTTIEVQATYVTIFMDRGPGLLRSTFPSDWQMNSWYDVAFKLLGDVNSRNWTKSTEDMVATIRSSYAIPSDIAQYVNPILDALPDLVRGSAVNTSTVAATYVGRWSLELLKTFSESNKATDEFSAALINFIQRITQTTLQDEYRLTIQWMPGLFYKFFPGDKTVIQTVYTKMAEGIKIFNPESVETSSTPTTKLSTMIENLIQKFGVELPPAYKSLVVSLSHMFYELMKVTSIDYSNYVDEFATVIDDEFREFPNINVGTIMDNLITKMGGEVPVELQPLLRTIQPLVAATVLVQPIDAAQVFKAMKDITSVYKLAYRSSPFPKLAERFLDLMYMVTAMNSSTPREEINDLHLEFQFWNIDLQFAIIKTYNFESDELYRMIAKAWPEFHVYMRVLKAMDPEDVTQFIKGIIKFYSQDPPYTVEGFIEAIKPSLKKITKAIDGLIEEMRQWFAPDTCKFTSCNNEDLCNTRQLVSSQQPFKRDPTATLAPFKANASNRQISASALLQIATLWISAKVLL